MFGFLSTIICFLCFLPFYSLFLSKIYFPLLSYFLLNCFIIISFPPFSLEVVYFLSFLLVVTLKITMLILDFPNLMLIGTFTIFLGNTKILETLSFIYPSPDFYTINVMCFNYICMCINIYIYIIVCIYAYIHTFI